MIPRPAVEQELAGYRTLRQVADLVGLRQADSLRQRLARGTLRAVKVGTLWLVPPEEVARVVAAGRGRGGRQPRSVPNGTGEHDPAGAGAG